MVALVRLGRHLNARHVGRSRVLELHRLQRMVHVRRSVMGAAGRYVPLMR
jgi:hypothetical protein